MDQRENTHTGVGIDMKTKVTPALRDYIGI
jgi:hypothetical protein